MWASQLSDAGVERLKEQSVKRKYMLLPSAYGQLPERKIHALPDFGAVDYVLVVKVEVENENQNWHGCASVRKTKCGKTSTASAHRSHSPHQSGIWFILVLENKVNANTNHHG